MDLFFEPRIFKRFASIRAALTLRGPRDVPFGFNMSLSVGDDDARVHVNRARLAARLGFAPARLAVQRQVHSRTVRVVTDGYLPAESDALITTEPAWLLGISVADCIPVLIVDTEQRIVAGVHSGWRGTVQDIVGATIDRLRDEFDVETTSLHVYIGPAASQCCYEVGEDVAGRFDARHSRALRSGKYLFDNKGVVLQGLLDRGVPPLQVELDPRCTICDENFQSFRRDGAHSGRMLAAIGIVPAP